MSLGGSILSSVLQMGAPLVQAYFSNQNNEDMSNLDTHMAPFQATTDTLNQGSLNRIDPNSTYNVSQDNIIKQDSLDMHALSNMKNERAVTGGGISNYSGIINQQNRAANMTNEFSVARALDIARQNRQNTGYDMLKNVGDMQMKLGALRTQRDLSKFNLSPGSAITAGAAGLGDYWMNQWAQGGGEGFDTAGIEQTLNQGLGIDWDAMFPSFGGGNNDIGFQNSLNNSGGLNWTPSFLND